MTVSRRAALCTALLETAALYGLLTWVYVAVHAATDLDGLDARLIHWVPLRVDTAGVVGFAVSALCFFLLGAGRGTGEGTRR